MSGVLTDLGWRRVYSWLAVIVVAVVVPLSLFLRRKLPAEATALSDSATRPRAPVRRPRLPRAGAAAGRGRDRLLRGDVHAAGPYRQLRADLGFGPAAGARMLSLMLLGGVVSRLVSGAISDRLGGVATVLIGSACNAWRWCFTCPGTG